MDDNVHSIRPQTVEKNKADILEASDMMIAAGQRILRLSGAKFLELLVIDPETSEITHIITMTPKDQL